MDVAKRGVFTFCAFNDFNDLGVAKRAQTQLLRELAPSIHHPQTDFWRSLEVSGQQKLFRVARQDDERIRARPDLIILISDAADFVCWSFGWLWSRSNGATVLLRRRFRLE
jgi:hypothetical protein